MIKDEQYHAKVHFRYAASLKACPFCGGWQMRLSENEDADGDNDANYVSCETCWTTGPGAETPTKAIEAWNTRELAKPLPKETREVKLRE